MTSATQAVVLRLRLKAVKPVVLALPRRSRSRRRLLAIVNQELRAVEKRAPRRVQ